MSSSTMMDIVVVPTISLNPKKAKKKLKKAARMHEDSSEPQLPVNDPLFGLPKENISVMEHSFTQEQRFVKAPSPKTAPTRVTTMPEKQMQPARPQAQAARPKAPEAAVTLLTPQVAPVLPLKSCAAEAKVMPEGTMKRSWFDITEEDDDNFLGFSALEGSSLQVVA